MGFFDSVKNALGGGDKITDSVKGPSLVLREAGIDPANMKFDINSDGSVAVNGWVDSQVISDRVSELLGKIPSVKAVHNNLQIGAPAAEAPPAAEPVEPADPPAQPAPEPATVNPEAAQPLNQTAAAASGHEYTVQAGDSLWKIAEAELGNGARYMEIFEANTDILDNPDLIKPGQVLKIPAA